MSVKSKSVIIQIIATEQYFPVVLTLYIVLKGTHWNERCITEHYTPLLW